MQPPKPAMARIRHDIHQLMRTVISGYFAGAAIGVCEMLRRFGDSKKRSLQAWLSQHDSHLKPGLTNQGTQQGAIW